MSSAEVWTRPASRGVRPERVFLFVGAFFGLSFLFVTPPFQAPDEPAHFFRAFQVSEGGLFPAQHQGVPGAWLPQSLLTTAGRAAPGVAFHPEKKASLENLLALTTVPLAPAARRFMGLPNTSRYPPFVYLPQAAAIAAGRILGLSPISLTYAGRLGNLTAWLCLGYLALAATPILAWPMLLLLLMPMSLFEAASLSADAMTNIVAFLLIARCLRLAVGEIRSVGNGEWALLWLLAVATALSKQVYLPLAAVVLWIPSRKFGDRGRQIACLSIAAVATALAWGAWALVLARTRVELQPYTNVPEQLGFVAHHPAQFARIIVDTLRAHPGNLVHSFVGVLGWLDTPLPTWFIRSYCLLLALATLTSGRAEVSVSASQRLLAVMMASACVLAVLVAAYATWTRVGNPIIEGLQGRYFIPLSPLACVGFYSPRFAIDEKISGPVVAICCVLSGALTVLVLLQRYW